MNLTEAQRNAIAARGNVLVVAGAGTGKTRTLVERCLQILTQEKPPVTLDQVLIVTFTEAAAAEVRQRIRARLEQEAARSAGGSRWLEQLALFESAWIGTLHSFCFELVRRHFFQLELDPQLAVLSKEEAHLLAQDDDRNSLVFQVDLFSARGALPRTMADVLGRHKDILYSSRTRQVTDSFARLQRWKNRCYEALMKVPDGDLTDDERALRDKLAVLPRATILQIIYQQKSYEGNARDYEFSPDSMHEHWKNGHEDTVRSLKRKDWLAMPPKHVGVVTHDVHRENEGR